MRVLIVSIVLAAGLASARARSRGDLEAEATAAMTAALPSGARMRFRGLDAWVQEPGNVSVCGEVSIDDAPAAIPEPGGTPHEERWRAFFAARGTTGGWRAVSPEGRSGAWRFGLNPTRNTAADQAACLAEMRRSLPADGPPPAADFVRRCPIESAVFWGDYDMTCAGHATHD